MELLVVHNPDPDSSLPYLLRVPLEEGTLVFRTKGTWPRTTALYCHPVPAEEWPDGAEVVDVRTAEEFDSGHLDGAVNIDYQAADFAERVSELPREKSYVVYCASGRRATGAVEQMRDLGFTDVVNGGGYTDLAG